MRDSKKVTVQPSKTLVCHGQVLQRKQEHGVAQIEVQLCWQVQIVKHSGKNGRHSLVQDAYYNILRIAISETYQFPNQNRYVCAHQSITIFLYQNSKHEFRIYIMCDQMYLSSEHHRSTCGPKKYIPQSTISTRLDPRNKLC